MIYMKIVISGNRNLHYTLGLINDCVNQSGFVPTEVTSCDCEPLNKIIKIWAKSESIPFKEWKDNCLEYVDALILIHKNTRDSLALKWKAKKLGLKIYEKVIL